MKYLRDYITPTNIKETKVLSRLNYDITKFVKDSKVAHTNKLVTDQFVSDYNNLLSDLYLQGYLTLSVEHGANGIRIVDSYCDEWVDQLSDIDKSYVSRKPKDILPLFTFDSELHEADIVTNGGMEFDTLVALKYLGKKRNALSRGIEFKLTLADMARIMRSKRCYYSNVPLTLDGVNKLTIDRIDASKPYDRANAVACSKQVNDLKNKLLENQELIKDMSGKEVKKMLLSLAELV